MDLAIWTAKVPTPPEAPLIKTFCPALSCPLSRRPCSAVTPAIGTAAACSKVEFAGLSAMPTSVEVTYSATAPSAVAKHFIADPKMRHLRSDRLHAAGEVHAQAGNSRPPDARQHRPHGVRQATHAVPVDGLNDAA